MCKRARTAPDVLQALIVSARLFAFVFMWMSVLLGDALVPVQAQTADTLYRISFVDKGSSAFDENSELYQSVLSTFAPDAIKRRELHGKQPILDSADKPIPDAYLDILKSIGIRPILVLNWSNAVIAPVTAMQRFRLQHSDTIASVVPVSKLNYRKLGSTRDCTPQRPGESQIMHALINTTPLHDAGVLGGGFRYGLIDCGFRWETMSALQHLTLVGTHDFVHGDSVVSNQPNDIPSQDQHGSVVLSVAGGWLQDTMIGIAPDAAFLLAKTENLEYERRIEEEAYCAAVEWLEKNGAWVISSSVGYYALDSTEEQPTWAVMTGATTWASQFVNRVTELGVSVTVAAGNSGPDSMTIIIPSEADSAISVGAATADRAAWSKSSTGPTALGKDKPDIGCLGVNVLSQDPEGSLKPVSGTSVAAPQIGGSLLLLRSLYPDATSYVLRNALYKSCTIADSVGKKLGHGIPNVTSAAIHVGSSLAPGIGPLAVIPDGGGVVHFVCCVFSSTETSVVLEARSDTVVTTFPGSRVDSLWYSFALPTSVASNGELHVRVVCANQSGLRTMPADNSLLTIRTNQELIPCGMRIPPSATSVAIANAWQEAPLAFPNPVHRGTDIVVRSTLPMLIRLLHTITGMEIPNMQATPVPEGFKVHIGSVPDGHYLLILERGGGVQTVPIIVIG